MKPLTRPQREALRRIYRDLPEFNPRDGRDKLSYIQFRRTAQNNNLMNCVMVPMPHLNMWLGIEPDGYTHS